MCLMDTVKKVLRGLKNIERGRSLKTYEISKPSCVMDLNISRERGKVNPTANLGIGIPSSPVLGASQVRR